MTVRSAPGGIVIEDTGAPLTDECEPSGTGRFCRGTHFGVVDVFLGDGDDRLDHDLYGAVDAGEGDDDIRVTKGIFDLVGGAGADRLDATGATEAYVSYFGHTAGVTVLVNGLPDDGAPGEGDNVLGAITSIAGGAGNDHLEAGPATRSLFGADGDDTLVGNADRNYLDGGAGRTSCSPATAPTRSGAVRARTSSAAVADSTRSPTAASRRCGSASATGRTTGRRARATTSGMTSRVSAAARATTC